MFTPGIFCDDVAILGLPEAMLCNAANAHVRGGFQRNPNPCHLYDFKVPQNGRNKSLVDTFTDNVFNSVTLQSSRDVGNFRHSRRALPAGAVTVSPKGE